MIGLYLLMMNIIKTIFKSPYLNIKIIFNMIYYVIKNPTLKLGKFVEIKNVKFGKYNYIADKVLISKSSIDNYSYIARCSWLHNTDIGKFTSIGNGVMCGLGIHPTSKYVSSHPLFYSNQKQVGISFLKESTFDEEGDKVIIGNDAFIGMNVIILNGVKIGNGAIIAAGSVVTKNVDNYTIVAGVPAKEIRKRFNNEHIKYLNNLQWWNKDEKWIKDNISLFSDIENLISAV